VLDRKVRQTGMEPSAQFESTLSEVSPILSQIISLDRAQEGNRPTALGDEDAFPFPGSLQVLAQPRLQGLDSDFRQGASSLTERGVFPSRT
jgi:hypothetical protein